MQYLLLQSADLTWTINGSETQWNLQYGLSGFAPGTGTTVLATTMPYSLSGLNAATSYDFWVQVIVAQVIQVTGPVQILLLLSV